MAGAKDWQNFVINYGALACVHELAAVVGQTTTDVQRLRNLGACTKLAAPKGFVELFILWHGRQPEDADWPPPRKVGRQRTYAWQSREVAMLASLVGTLSVQNIADVLTNRLRLVTGDTTAERSQTAVQVRMNLIGLQTTDVVGGITTTAAATEINSLAIIHQSIASGELKAHRQGRLWVIPHDAWTAWKATRTFPPKGYVQLSTIRESLGIRSDKLSEYARMNLIPTAIRCNPYGTGRGGTKFGTWWIAPAVAKQILDDRKAGRPMPWSGRYDGNIEGTFKLWKKRQHPADCTVCADIWGKKGAPADYKAFAERYPPLAHGIKRHLTRPWAPGMTVAEIATACSCPQVDVRRAIRNNALAVTIHKGRQYASRTDVTRWKARKCPSGESDKSWLSLATAAKLYLFTERELRGYIKKRELRSKVGTDGAMRGVTYVMRHQCGQLREKLGFTEEEAARRVGVSVEKFRHLLEGVGWRKAKGIPLVTVQAVIKRVQSRCGHTLEEAADALGVPLKWVLEHKHLIRVSRPKWDLRRTYISEPMFQRLRAIKEAPPRDESLGSDWLRNGDAAKEAGVSRSTILNWMEAGELKAKPSKNGQRFHREAVRARARLYWKTVRFHRAVPPEWLQAEREAAPVIQLDAAANDVTDYDSLRM